MVTLVLKDGEIFDVTEKIREFAEIKPEPKECYAMEARGDKGLKRELFFYVPGKAADIVLDIAPAVKLTAHITNVLPNPVPTSITSECSRLAIMWQVDRDGEDLTALLDILGRWARVGKSNLKDCESKLGGALPEWKPPKTVLKKGDLFVALVGLGTGAIDKLSLDTKDSRRKWLVSDLRGTTNLLKRNVSFQSPANTVILIGSRSLPNLGL
jgi:hypothetical protein